MNESTAANSSETGIAAYDLRQHPKYDEGWQGRVYRWLGRRVELLARKVGYTGWRIDPRYHVLDPLADWLVFKAVRRGLSGIKLAGADRD